MLYPVKKESKKSFPPINKGLGKGFGIGSPGFPFNPNFDGNALAWYDGDIGLTNLQWNDQGAGGHDIIFANLPTIIPNALNTHQIVRFDGVNQNGLVLTPVMNQPYSIYIVVNSVTFTGNDAIFEDGVIFAAKRFYQAGVSPNLNFSANLAISGNPDLAIGTFGVMSMIANGVNGEIRTNLNAAVIGNAGATNSAGITLGSRHNNTFYANFETAYLIFRAGADNTATQNKLINGLNTRFAL